MRRKMRLENNDHRKEISIIKENQAHPRYNQ